jgi:DNA-directed RNA polymerase specialized sigma24 family protein
MSSGSLGKSWIGQLKAGDPVAAQKLFEAYFQDLVRFAQKKLRAAPRRVADEEDAALSAINSFYQGAVEGRFPQLNDPDDLWKILVTITARKALRQAQHADRQKRGGGKVRGQSVFHQADASRQYFGIDQIVGQEPTPAFAAEMADEFQRLLDRLPEDTLRQVAVLKMQGHTNEEIATRLGCALRSVERKLGGIRAIWSREGEPR